MKEKTRVAIFAGVGIGLAALLGYLSARQEAATPPQSGSLSGEALPGAAPTLKEEVKELGAETKNALKPITEPLGRLGGEAVKRTKESAQGAQNLFKSLFDKSIHTIGESQLVESVENALGVTLKKEDQGHPASGLRRAYTHPQTSTRLDYNIEGNKTVLTRVQFPSSMTMKEFDSQAAASGAKEQAPHIWHVGDYTIWAKENPQGGVVVTWEVTQE